MMRFNCAAPIPGRLFDLRISAISPLRALQSCRPYSGAVMRLRIAVGACAGVASIVPPLFRGGYGAGAGAFPPGLRASIVPPLFRGGYGAGAGAFPPGLRASIVPPLFRGGYQDVQSRRLVGHQLASIVPPLFRGGYSSTAFPAITRWQSFNRAAPIPGRLSGNSMGNYPYPIGCFNRAAPIPGRLRLRPGWPWSGLPTASIVPPLFRGAVMPHCP